MSVCTVTCYNKVTITIIIVFVIIYFCDPESGYCTLQLPSVIYNPAAIVHGNQVMCFQLLLSFVQIPASVIITTLASVSETCLLSSHLLNRFLKLPADGFFFQTTNIVWHLLHLVSRVPDQNCISRLYNMLEIYHSGPEPSICD